MLLRTNLKTRLASFNVIQYRSISTTFARTQHESVNSKINQLNRLLLGPDEASSLHHVESEWEFTRRSRKKIAKISMDKVPKDTFELFKKHGFEPTRTLFVANVPFNVGADEIKHYFKEFGVHRVMLKPDKEGRSPGYCHVLFEGVEGAANVLQKSEHNRFIMQDRILRFRPAENLKLHDNARGATRRLFFSNFNPTFPNPLMIASRLLPLPVQNRVAVSPRFDRIPHAFGFLMFSELNDAMRAKEIIAEHCKEHPSTAFLCRYTINPYEDAQRLSSDGEYVGGAQQDFSEEQSNASEAKEQIS